MITSTGTVAGRTGKERQKGTHSPQLLAEDALRPSVVMNWGQVSFTGGVWREKRPPMQKLPLGQSMQVNSPVEYFPLGQAVAVQGQQCNKVYCAEFTSKANSFKHVLIGCKYLESTRVGESVGVHSC